MYIISFNSKRCVKCGNCESILGDLYKRILFNKLVIYDEEYDNAKGLIAKMISKCFLDTITISFEENNG